MSAQTQDENLSSAELYKKAEEINAQIQDPEFNPAANSDHAELTKKHAELYAAAKAKESAETEAEIAQLEQEQDDENWKQAQGQAFAEKVVEPLKAELGDKLPTDFTADQNDLLVLWNRAGEGAKYDSKGRVAITELGGVMDKFRPMMQAYYQNNKQLPPIEKNEKPTGETAPAPEEIKGAPATPGADSNQDPNLQEMNKAFDVGEDSKNFFNPDVDNPHLNVWTSKNQDDIVNVWNYVAQQHMQSGGDQTRAGYAKHADGPPDKQTGPR